jgi:hypothetical protein
MTVTELTQKRTRGRNRSIDFRRENFQDLNCARRAVTEGKSLKLYLFIYYLSLIIFTGFHATRGQ